MNYIGKLANIHRKQTVWIYKNFNTNRYPAVLSQKHIKHLL